MVWLLAVEGTNFLNIRWIPNSELKVRLASDKDLCFGHNRNMFHALDLLMPKQAVLMRWEGTGTMRS